MTLGKPNRENAAFDQGPGTPRRQVPWCTQEICGVPRYLGGAQSAAELWVDID